MKVVTHCPEVEDKDLGVLAHTEPNDYTTELVVVEYPYTWTSNESPDVTADFESLRFIPPLVDTIGEETREYTEGYDYDEDEDYEYEEGEEYEYEEEKDEYARSLSKNVEASANVTLKLP